MTVEPSSKSFSKHQNLCVVLLLHQFPSVSGFALQANISRRTWVETVNMEALIEGNDVGPTLHLVYTVQDSNLVQMLKFTQRCGPKSGTAGLEVLAAASSTRKEKVDYRQVNEAEDDSLVDEASHWTDKIPPKNEGLEVEEGFRVCEGARIGKGNEELNLREKSFASNTKAGNGQALEKYMLWRFWLTG
ncbi:hypothetical protein EV359DRAFT_63856 [Lentinula novae-zelandiae]|nr:hypothetical protein EV359DRAFT_63856 [Lentinula novae-zelandiae]